MSKVAADAIATLNDVIGRKIRAARKRAILDVASSQLTIPRTLSIPWGRWPKFCHAKSSNLSESQ